MEKNGELSVPPVPGRGFREGRTAIAWDSEILQSFTELTNITNITSQYFNNYEDSLEDFTYQIVVGSYRCGNVGHHHQCVPPHNYYPWYIWTKEGLKLKIKVFRFIIIISLISIF